MVRVVLMEKGFNHVIPSGNESRSKGVQPYLGSILKGEWEKSKPNYIKRLSLTMEGHYYLFKFPNVDIKILIS